MKKAFYFIFLVPLLLSSCNYENNNIELPDQVTLNQSPSPIEYIGNENSSDLADYQQASLALDEFINANIPAVSGREDCLALAHASNQFTITRNSCPEGIFSAAYCSYLTFFWQTHKAIANVECNPEKFCATIGNTTITFCSLYTQVANNVINNFQNLGMDSDYTDNLLEQIDIFNAVCAAECSNF